VGRDFPLFIFILERKGWSEKMMPTH